jgi:hypothetical protein
MIYSVGYKFNETDIAYSLTVEDVQSYAQEILKRQLTTDEIIDTIDNLNDGINVHLDLIMRSIFVFSNE